MLTQKLTGANWVKNLPNYMKCVINEKREALGWQSSFGIYFARKSNELVKCGVPERKGSPEIEMASKPTDIDMKRLIKQRSKSGKKHVDAEGFPLDLYLEVPFSKYLDNILNDGTYDDEITLRAAAELFNIELLLVSTLGRATKVTAIPRNFSLQSRAFLGHFAENQREHYVALGQIDDFESSEVVTPTLDRSVIFEVSTTTPSKSFVYIPSELIKRILLTAIRSCGYV